MDMSTLRGLAKGTISTSDARRAMNENYQPTAAEIAEDNEIIQECTDLGMGIILQGELLDGGDQYDAAVNESCVELRDYLVGQGVINESSISITNPKMNYVRLNKQAQINRLKRIITLKLARKASRPAFKKYKIGMAMKRSNMDIMDKEFGQRAERLAKQAWQELSKKGKVKAKIEEKRPAAKKK